jgi:GNAT superfamily N-acetyltransferase
MSDSMPVITLTLSPDDYRRLPRNAAYRYEYHQGQGILIPRPRHYHALLPLTPMATRGDLAVRPLGVHEFPALAPLFAEVFRHIQPYGSLDESGRRNAATQALDRTRTGGDGPWIEQASFVARRGNELIGAVLITLLPDGDPSTWDCYRWEEPPPADCIERRQGRPHLTWIFVAPTHAGRGLGTALLGAAVNSLLKLGFTELLSTFLIGNESSMLWHWRNGFGLLPYPDSRRQAP